MRRRAAVALLTAAGLFAALQLGFGTAADADPRLRDPAYADKLVAFDRLPPDPPVLMLGSSRTLLGFHAGRFERATGTPAFNFGFPAAGPITELVYLNRLLARGVRPKLLLVEVLPPLLADGPGGPVEHQFLPGDRLTGAEVDLVEGFGFPREKVRPKWEQSRLAPAFALRHGLLARVLPGWVPDHRREDWGRKADPSGWTTPPKTHATGPEREALTEKAHAEYAGTLAGLDPDGRPLAALRRVVDTARDRGIPVVLVLMPEGASFRAMYPAGRYERVKGLVAALGVPLLDARDWVPDDDLYDGHHPFTQGAEAFTDKLADEPAVRGVLK